MVSSEVFLVFHSGLGQETLRSKHMNSTEIEVV